MIDALIGGKLHGKPTQRIGASGKPFVTCKVRTPLADGESLFINAIAFDKTVGAALLALDDGDSVSLSGALTPKVWADRNGEVRPSLDLVAHAVLTAYHVTRKRAAMKAAPAGDDQHAAPAGFDNDAIF
jgi:single-stranded DNA-binding protein